MFRLTPAVTAGAIAFLLVATDAGLSQEVAKPAPKYGDMSTVTQDLLNRAGTDGIHTNTARDQFAGECACQG